MRGLRDSGPGSTMPKGADEWRHPHPIPPPRVPFARRASMPAYTPHSVLVTSVDSSVLATRRAPGARVRRLRLIDDVWCDLHVDRAFGCDATRAQLHKYVDDELNARDPVERQMRQSMMAHLSRCDSCARREAQLQSMRQALAAVGARTLAGRSSPVNPS